MDGQRQHARISEQLQEVTGGRQEAGTTRLHGTVEKGKLTDSDGEEVIRGAGGAMVRGQEETSGVTDTSPT